MRAYNQKKKARFDEEQKMKFNKHMMEFKQKYAQNVENLWITVM